MIFKKYETNYKLDKCLKLSEIDGFKESMEGKENNIVIVYPEIEYQEITGFGGAITESSGYVFSKFPEDVKNKFIKDYFSEQGIGYNFCRLPIQSCDFSISSYCYSDTASLDNFSITRDKEYIIPLIKAAQKENPTLKFLASPWSPSTFMKTNNSMCHGGKLKDEYKKLWAQYICKYIMEYAKEGIKIDYITVQNEPDATQIWESCLYNAKEEADFAFNYLLEELNENKLDTKVMIWDHNKEKVYLRSKEIFSKDVDNKIAGIAYHYYSGDHFENLGLVREKYPEKLLIHTEGCTGISINRSKRQIQNAEIYAHDIIGDLNAGGNAYIDWNILLDYFGGPNHVHNYCNSPVMSYITGKNYKKNASFYYIGHFSKFIKPGAKRIAFSKYTSNIEVTAFKNFDNKLVIVLLNRTDKSEKINIVLNGKCHSEIIQKHSIVTYVI